MKENCESKLFRSLTSMINLPMVNNIRNFAKFHSPVLFHVIPHPLFFFFRPDFGSTCTEQFHKIISRRARHWEVITIEEEKIRDSKAMKAEIL